MCMARGVDVSRHQATVNWSAARNDVSFAYVKVTEGVGYVDPKVDQHLTGARTAGLVTGLYHFARPDTNSASVDAEHFASEVNTRHAAAPGNLPPCLDLEELRPGALAHIDLPAWVAEFLAVARRETGRRQFMLYCSAYFARDRLKGLGWLDNDCLAWVAHHGRTPGKPGWSDHRTVMHQFTSTGRVDGYAGNIDLNDCWVDLDLLTEGGAPDPQPPPEPGAPKVYVVKSGDTLSEIADTLAYPGGWRALYADNRDIIGDDPNHIEPGWRLRLPRTAPGRPPAQKIHVVEDGENLTVIARRYRLPGGWKQLWDANRDTVEDPDVIIPGQRLIIPR